MAAKIYDKYHPYISEYMELVESGKVAACKDQHMLMDFVRWKLDTPGIIIDSNAIENSVAIPEKHFPFKLQPWERFINAFIYGVRYPDGRLMFDQYFIMLGRGAGKNGFISYNIFFMLTKHLGIPKYDIDLVATTEEQATRSFNDVYDVIYDIEGHIKDKKKRIFSATKELITHKGTKSTLRYNTSNARTKDSKRTGVAIFDELHQYENYDNISVYVSGLGKKKDPREFYITTDGNVRGGVLDGFKEKAQLVLNKELPESTMFPFICRIDAKEEADDPDMWVKAIPSLPYNPTLFNEIRKQHYDMQTNDKLYMNFYQKRMNFPLDDIFNGVATYEEIKATNKPMPELTHRLNAIGGVDYADKRDFCACGILFKHDGKRYFLHHSFVFRDSIRMQGINQEIIDIGVRDGFITLVGGKEIPTDLLVGWFMKQAEKFNILKIACDDYRAAILNKKFTDAGLNIEKVRKGAGTHSRLAPLVQEMFVNETIVFPGDFVMRWYCGNVYKHVHTNENIEYRKIESKKRKTDGWFAFLHALNFDSELTENAPLDLGSFKVYSY